MYHNDIHMKFVFKVCSFFQGGLLQTTHISNAFSKENCGFVNQRKGIRIARSIIEKLPSDIRSA